ncbi:hypothetical protein EMIHUDRAFT_198748 [Emiliania huxleyi CCMP1516]|uniref:TIR domain-containing protein n=2 Tax=Emiliania huxleyi TaxID=2903 RepID=A0A0D3I7T0_EMIH1|nr:hypothetical protein EMIHUDRAFT_198748 [Emiliania huxleyi CCMP1516]EOD07315.1 hypothetical protein EMIHUDRAFT_198748 [Emiliania huxleyi CCMP1516]|eukprot:XP_005759744.1 hypothetical protein EMIHUDRAFT_198748 [Emiliania huxleyi CCMP1516]
MLAVTREGDASSGTSWNLRRAFGPLLGDQTTSSVGDVVMYTGPLQPVGLLLGTGSDFGGGTQPWPADGAIDVHTGDVGPTRANNLHGHSSSAPGRARQRGQSWSAFFLLLLEACGGVLLSEWMWPPRFGVRCRTGSKRGAWLLLLVALLPLASSNCCRLRNCQFTIFGERHLLDLLRSLIEGDAVNISIYLPPSDVEIIDSDVRGCSANEGGVVYAQYSGAVSITGSTVTGCSAVHDGGVVSAVESGAVSIIGSTVTGCSAGDDGGVVDAASSGAISIIGSTVTGCSAGKGSVVYASSSGAVSIIGSTVTGCSAVYEGGVVYARGSGAVSLIGSTVSGCSADVGGVVSAEFSGAVSLIGSDVSGCSAGDRGGVVYAEDSGAVLLSHRALVSTEAWGRFRARVDIIESQVGFQPKFKVLVGFYQIATTLGPVYGVRLNEAFTRWTKFMDSLSFDVIGLTYPGACMGSMRVRLMVAGLWPLVAILLGGAALACHALAEWLMSGRADDLRRDVVRATLRRILYWAILVAYLVLPSVSRTILKVEQCESFAFNDITGEKRSYLVADLDVLCGADDEEYSGLDAYFWAFFVLWPVLVPLAFLALLLWIRSEVRAQRVGSLARASRFLWRDYDPGILFWEVVDLSRRLFLASLVLFIQTNTGSSKLLRLIIASVVSGLYLTALALARPFKRTDDLYLACTANLLLLCCFISGIVIQLCPDPGASAAYEGMCYTLVGFDSARGASEFVIVLTAAMLAASLLVVLFKTVSAVRMPTIRLASTGRPPALELCPECHFHGFISHAWGTGQDQTHTVVRQLQLLLPGVRIWLDVDNLEDVGRLEESVADAMTFLVFLSAGYFKSFNCRRELYAALASNRPFIPIFEADAAKGGASIEALQAECREHCVEVVPPAYPSYGGPGEMIARVFEEAKPIVWVRVNAFQLESLKAIALRMLLHSPFYASRLAELAAGVTVPGEAGPVAFSGPVTILACRGNKGAFGVADEGASAAPLSGHYVLLLYLNDKTFLDAGGTVARLVQAAMDRRIAIVLVHEQDPSCGGRPFRHFIQQTPQVLQRSPYKLYDTVAVPLYPSTEHRPVSLHLVLRGMGAAPCSAGILRRQWQLLRRRIAGGVQEGSSASSTSSLPLPTVVVECGPHIFP